LKATDQSPFLFWFLPKICQGIKPLFTQIEYWAKIGQIMIDNSDLTYEFVRESLLAKEEVKQELLKPYVRRTKRESK
jgi:hypothetical protein